MTDPDSLRERLAALEHEQWAHWTEYMLVTIRKELVERMAFEAAPDIDNLLCIKRWRRQIDTEYSELTEAEKDSDREWADKVLLMISQEEPMMVLPDGWLERAEELLNEVGITLPPSMRPSRLGDRPADSINVHYTVTAGTASSAAPLTLKPGETATSNVQWPDEEAEPDPEDREE
jgi:hypothetical protein